MNPRNNETEQMKCQYRITAVTSDLRQNEGLPVPERPLEDVMSGKGFAGVALLLL
jgi:hypothetical protein